MSAAHTISWSHGQATVLETAAVLAECRFDLPSGPFSPFARAPWMGTVTDRSIIGHWRELGGDFVCVPFGAGGGEPYGPPEWAELMVHPPRLPIHGPAGDLDWTLVERTESSVTLGLDYPEGWPVARLERTVAGRPGSPALESGLTVYAREAARISLGLHPIMRLPERQGRLRLEADFAFGLTHPRFVVPDQAQEFSSLEHVPMPFGTVDLSHVPVGRPNVSAQLCGMRGPMTATWLDEGAGIVLDWDRAVLPSLQIWCTDRGIDGPPWHGSFRGIGLEPIASAFDFNTALSAADNPISRRGIPTAIAIDPAAPLVVSHSVAAFSV